MVLQYGSRFAVVVVQPWKGDALAEAKSNIGNMESALAASWSGPYDLGFGSASFAIIFFGMGVVSAPFTLGFESRAGDFAREVALGRAFAGERAARRGIVCD